jgi:hypothetical protein
MLEEMLLPTRRMLLMAAVASFATPAISAAAQLAKLRQRDRKFNLVISDCHVGTDKGHKRRHLRGLVDLKSPRIGRLHQDAGDLWEYTIEEILFAGVVGRFRPNVATMRLRVAHVDKSDYEAVYADMMRCSKYSGHDQATDGPADLSGYQGRPR